jgi:hypothetical protein
LASLWAFSAAEAKSANLEGATPCRIIGKTRRSKKACKRKIRYRMTSKASFAHQQDELKGAAPRGGSAIPFLSKTGASDAPSRHAQDVRRDDPLPDVLHLCVCVFCSPSDRSLSTDLCSCSSRSLEARPRSWDGRSPLRSFSRSLSSQRL